MMSYYKKNRQKIFVLLAAAMQLITPAFTEFDKKSTFNEPEIIPAGYTFSIWGVITFLSFLYAIYQAFPNRRNMLLHRRLGRALFVIYLLFSVWLFAADREWLISTVIVFVCMFGLLTLAFSEVLLQRDKLTLVEKIILEGQLALYTGWSTVAIFANLAACLKKYGILVSYSASGTLLQVIILLGALANSIYFIFKFRFNYTYTGTILWAFAGIYFGLVSKHGATALEILVIASGAIIVILALLEKRKLLNRLNVLGDAIQTRLRGSGR